MEASLKRMTDDAVRVAALMRISPALFVWGVALVVQAAPSADAPVGDITESVSRERTVSHWVIVNEGAVRVLLAGKPLLRVDKLKDVPDEPFTTEHVELRRLTLQPKELAPIAGLTHLKRLVISDSVIGRRGIEELATGCRALREIVFRQSCVDERSLEPLAAMKTLSGLSLENCGVGDPVLDLLAKMPQLRSLNLSGTLVDDAAAQRLGKMTRLKALILNRTSIGQAAIDALQKTLPDCKISYAPPAAGASPQPAGRPLPKAVDWPENVRVTGARGFVPVAIDTYCNPPLASFLRGAVVFAPRPLRAAPSEADGRIGLEIEQDALVLLGRLSGATPKGGATWIKELLSIEQMPSSGWVGVAELPMKDRRLGWQFAYCRECKKGELLRLRVDRSAPPIIVVLAAGTASPVGQPPDANLLPYTGAWVMRNQVDYLLRSEKFDGIEELIAAIRREKRHFRSGNSYLGLFYNGLVSARADERQYRQQEARLNAWLKARPESLAAHLAMVDHWVFFAWLARGSGWASSVTQEGWKLYGERLAVAQRWIRRAWQLEQRDAYLCRQEITLIRATAPDDQRVEELSRLSAEIDPTYRGTFFEGVLYYLPRWHGDPGDLERYAQRVLELTKKEWGTIVYAQMVWDAKAAHRHAVFDDFDFSWDLVKRGFEENRQRFPESNEPMSHLAVLAYIKGDRETARQAVSKLARNDPSGFDTSEEYEVFRRWLADDYASGQQAALYEGNHARIAQVFWTDGGGTLTTFDDTPQCERRDAATGERSRRRPLAGFLSSVCCNGRGELAVAMQTDGEVRLFDLAREISRPLGRRESLAAAALSPDGRVFVSAGADPEIQFWDTESGNLSTVWSTKPATIASLDFLPDGKSLIVGTRQNKAIIWAVADQSLVGELTSFAASVDMIRVSPDGKRAACLSGKELTIWDLETKTRLGTLENPAKQINAIEFSPSGDLLTAATGSRRPVANSDVLVWDIGQRKLIHRFAGHKAAVNAARFAPDGKTIVSCSDDGSLRLWKLAQEPADHGPMPVAGPAPRKD